MALKTRLSCTYSTEVCSALKVVQNDENAIYVLCHNYVALPLHCKSSCIFMGTKILISHVPKYYYSFFFTCKNRLFAESCCSKYILKILIFYGIILSFLMLIQRSGQLQEVIFSEEYVISP